eukprot:304616-Amorphochlora_amoeboformis.AAC.2
MKVGLVSHYAAAKRPYRGIGEGKQIYRAMIWTLAMALGLILLAVWLPAREDGHIDRNWHPTATSQPQLGGFWPFSRNCSKSYHRDLKSITKKLMTAAFATADKNKSGYLEVTRLSLFYYHKAADTTCASAHRMNYHSRIATTHVYISAYTAATHGLRGLEK